MAPSTIVVESDHIDKLASKLPDLIAKAGGHSEIWAIDLAKRPTSDPAKLILGKYLRAHNVDIDAAAAALAATLIWRKEFNPRSAAYEERHDTKFDGLGYITLLGEDVVTWNIYGAVASDPKSVFDPLDSFLRWRVGLMERSVDLKGIKDYIGDGLVDTKQGIQIHDYLNVSFFRMEPTAKAGSKRTIELMTKHYPETMKRKLFVNVPTVMGWMFSAMRLFLSKETMSKFTVLSYESYVAGELGHEDLLPENYGGKNTRTLSDIAEPHRGRSQTAEAATLSATAGHAQ